jgi:predicted NodU family carbamoyl transferase
MKNLGALLNTSLNLHRMPIALVYIDPLCVLDNSDLDVMVLIKS